MSLLEFIKRLFSAKDTTPKNELFHVAICVGHSRIDDTGANSIGGVSERTYNNVVANELKKKLEERGFQATIFNNYPRKSYGAAMRWLAKEIKTAGCDICIELHFNSASRDVAGFEYLFLGGSMNGRRLAKTFHLAHGSHYLAQKDRGIKHLVYGDNGHAFVKKTPVPAIICEPFFGSNIGEWNAFENATKELATVYANGIEDYFELF